MLSWRDAFYAMAEVQPVTAIAHHLLAPEQRHFLLESRLTLADVLTGRYPPSMTGDIQHFLFEPWNEALGREYFRCVELGSLAREAHSTPEFDHLSL